MTPSEALINEFLSSPDTQRWVAGALDYCARLSAAVAETHGFHDDEREVKTFMIDGLYDYADMTDDYEPLNRLPSWLESQLLQAEFGRIMSEAGEAIENIRKPGPDDKCPEYPGWQVEAIDILVRVFDTLGKRGISPGEIFIAKTLVNNGRPYKHGGNS